MGKSLSDLALKDEKLPTAGEALDNLPQFGQFAPPPQPGPMRFRLPKDLTNVWDAFEAGDGKGQRIAAVFDSASPLIIVQSKHGKYDNEPFETRLNNNERKRGKDGVVASDLDYLIAAIEGPGQKRPEDNKGYIAKVRTFGGKEFAGDMRWSWRCGENRNIRVRDAAGNLVEVENKKGCGEAYYQDRDVQPQANGEYPLEIQCTCGGVIRAFGNIDNIKKA